MDTDQRASSISRLVPLAAQPVPRPDVGDDLFDDDVWGLQVIPPSLGARLLASAAYLGALPIVVLAARPARRFPFEHTKIALVLHVIRFLWISAVLGLWMRSLPDDDTSYSLAHYASDAGLLLLVGLPRRSTVFSDALPWILTPLVVCWVFSGIGFVLAMMGRSIDLRALTSADWSDIRQRADWDQIRARREKHIARQAREKHLLRLQRSTQVVGVERVRRERSKEIEEDIARLKAEREHVERLLALGEVSRRRYDTMVADIDEEMASLRGSMNEILLRQKLPQRMPQRMRVHRQDRSPESEADSIAFVTRSGVPLFTYGSFHIDEALVAGILSAFDSISEEVFGSRVRKTELAEGKVMHFLHGQYVAVLAVFVEDPSPRQLEQLRTMLTQFEAANGGPLARGASDPAYLHEVHIPFKFRG